jgi:hypothetical protein
LYSQDGAKLEGWGLAQVQVFLLPACWNLGGLQVLPHEHASVYTCRPSSRRGQTFAGRAGDRVRKKVAWKKLPGQAFPDSSVFLGPRYHLGERAVRVPEKSSKEKLLAARARTGKVWRARSAGEGAKHPLFPSQVPGVP